MNWRRPLQARASVLPEEKESGPVMASRKANIAEYAQRHDVLYERTIPNLRSY